MTKKKTSSILVLLLFVISLSLLSGCTKDINCVFIGERANLHDEYIIEVESVSEKDTIFILRNSADVEKSEIIGRDQHYIEVVIKISRNNIENPKENKKLDVSCFKLKDHTGVKLGNLQFGSVQDGSKISNKSFSTTKAVNDYEWVDKEIEINSEKVITLFFEFSKDYSVYDTLMILETDFFKTKTGTDIVLANRQS